MIEDVLAQIISFFALAWIVVSYFVSKKNYLLFQGLGMICLLLSYLLKSNFFAMIGIGLGLCRALTFYAYETFEKDAPLILSFVFAGLTILSYLIVNLWIQKNSKIEDILYVISLAFYAFTFRIRDRKRLLYITLIPTTLALLYNIVCYSTVFIVCTYAFELCANIVAIFKLHSDKRKEN